MICTAADIHHDPHYRDRGMIEPAALPDGESVDLPGIVPKLTLIGPALGAHTDEILARLGVNDTELASLRTNGAV
jgi:crotonobetainyl-CoA:carnitine CoA-transferase CaiB-like acyl-CoA transferase